MRLFIIVLFILVAAGSRAQNSRKHIPAAHQTKKPTAKDLATIKAANIKKAVKTQFQYFITTADSATYGYSIYADGNLYIEQKNIPAIGGTKGFEDTATAGKCAQLVIQKIKQGEMPPSITTDDLKKINVEQ